MKGKVFKIETFSTQDGEGIRGVVFLSGCPLRCIYCHNPDSWTGGTERTAEEVADDLARYKPFYRNGGITISGGEPLVQGAFTCALLDAFHARGLSVALDTSGSVHDGFTEKAVKNADLILLDLKFATDEDYKKYTGGSIDRTLQFLRLCETHRKRVVIRIVVLPAVNDSLRQLAPYAEILQSFSCVEKAELLPFHRLGFEKYERLGLTNPAADIPAADFSVVKTLEKEFNLLLKKQLRV